MEAGDGFCGMCSCGGTGQAPGQARSGPVGLTPRTLKVRKLSKNESYIHVPMIHRSAGERVCLQRVIAVGPLGLFEVVVLLESPSERSRLPDVQVRVLLQVGLCTRGDTEVGGAGSA
eukprot:7832894-Pyramimonas_sp.AAC.2